MHLLKEPGPFMYRIKLTSGEETVYNSIDALAVAVRSGEVTPDALIYHRRADRWLAISTHPHYQTIQARSTTPAAPAAPVAQAPVQPVPTPSPATPPVPARPSQEAENEQAVENRDAMIQAKVQRLREMQRPLAEPRSPVSRAVVEPPALEPAAAPEPLPPMMSEAPAEPAASVETPPAEEDATAAEPVAESIPLEEADAEEALADLPMLEVEDTHEPVPSPDLVMPPAEEPAAGADFDYAPASPATPRRRVPVALAVAAIVTLAVTVGAVVWHPWSRGKGGDSVQTLASTSPSPTGLPSGATSAPVQPLEDTARTSSIVAPEIPAAPEQAPARGQDSIPTARAPRPPALQMDLNAASAALEPGVGSGTQISISPTVLASHYASAYDQAQSEMNARLSQIGFSDLFDATRLSSTEKLQSARRTLALAGATIRQYRERENRIELAYRDTLNQVGKRLGLSEQEMRGWDKRKILKESSESARMVDDLLAQIDNVYGLIAGEEGRYQVKGSSIVFSSPETARRYGTLRTAITPRVSSWSNTPPADLPATLRPVVRAIGNTRLPLETT